MVKYVSRGSVCLCILVLSMFMAACSEDSNSNTAPSPQPSSNPNHAYEGFLDVANCDLIAGWAWDKNNPDTPVNVDIYDGNSLIATLPATNLRPDLRDLKMGNGAHAFGMAAPPTLKDGKPHTIVAKVSTIVLMGGAKTLSCPSK